MFSIRHDKMRKRKNYCCFWSDQLISWEFWSEHMPEQDENKKKYRFWSDQPISCEFWSEHLPEQDENKE